MPGQHLQVKTGWEAVQKFSSRIQNLHGNEGLRNLNEAYLIPRETPQDNALYWAAYFFDKSK